MNSLELVSKKKDILNKIAERRIKESFEDLIQVSVNLQDWRVSEKLSELETNYRYMLHYQFEGVDDAQRAQVYDDIIRSLYEITDDVFDELLVVESASVFFDKMRISRLMPTVSLQHYAEYLKNLKATMSVMELSSDLTDRSRYRDIAVKREREGVNLFNTIFVSPRSTKELYEDYIAFFEDEEVGSKEKCLFISALTLNLLHRFDSKKFLILLRASKDSDMNLSQRALVGVIIILQLYDPRINLYKECVLLLESLLEESAYYSKSIRTIIKQLIQSRETEKISKKLTEEIIPDMMKFNTLAGKKLNMEELMGDGDFSDKNPEWKKELEESGLADKLQEYSNLQMEGADVFHSTFAHLKNFSFFREISNWFLPFDSSYSELQGLSSGSGDNILFSALLSSGHMCDSDKYSFALSLLQIPTSQREMMIHQFGAESEEVKKLQKEAQELNPRVSEEIISNQYIQSLYRFFKLNTNKSSFLDIFSFRLDFYDKETIEPFISDKESMRVIAHYCFDKNFFSEALNIYEKIILKYGDDTEIFQRIGYCKQMLQDFSGALEAYLHADLLQASNSWILKRIAQMYKSLKQPDLSLEYYKKASVLNPDDFSLEMNIGHCYLELKEYDKALNSYYRIELLDKNGKKAWRPIAWTSLLTKKYDVAQKYYQQILNDKPTEHDFLNAGHVELCQGNLKKALNYYKQVIAIDNKDVDYFILLFNEDREILIGIGLEESFIPVLFDQLRFVFD